MLGEILAGAEHPAGAGQDDRAHAAVIGRRDDSIQQSLLGDGREGGSPHRDRRDRAGNTDRHRRGAVRGVVGLARNHGVKLTY